MNNVLKFVLLVIGSYLLGGVMFAKLLSKFEKSDITSAGSGNPGATNMMRNHGFIFGFLTFILDGLKGVASSLTGFLIFGGADGGMLAQTALYAAGLSAVIGHIFPIYYKFKGGKGVATSAGVVFVAHPFIGLILFAVYCCLLVVTRIGSLSSLIVAFAYLVTDTVLLSLDGNYIAIILLYFIVGLIVWGHRSNIKRLAEKRENVLDLKAVAEKDKARIQRIKQNFEKKNSKQKVEAQSITENKDSNN